MNRKHRLFIENYILHKFDAPEAYQATYPKAERSTAYTQSCILLKNPKIKSGIDNRIKELNIDSIITRDFLLQKLVDLFNDPKTPRAVKVRCIELLGKANVIWADKIEHKGDVAPPTYVINTVNQTAPARVTKLT